MNTGSSREYVKGAGMNTRGFTLIEMLVVLLIMGLMVGLVSAIARPDDRARLQVEAARLAALLDFAAEQSRLTGKSIAWTANGSGYRFWQLQEETGWSEVRESDLLRARSLPQGMMISDLRVETMRPQGDMRLEFIPYGSTLAFTIEMSLGAERYAVAASPVGDVQALPNAGEQNGNLALR
jgi:general secretion pathway protein H